MCGRYYRKTDKQKIAEAFHATLVDDGTPSPPWVYNVAPTTIQPIIRNSCGRLRASRETVLMHLTLGRIRHYAQLATLVRQQGFKPTWPMDYLFFAAQRV